MLREDFKRNLLKCMDELEIREKDKFRFMITSIIELGKKLNTTDEYMKLAILTNENLENRYFDLDGVIKILSGPDSRFPIWITVEIIEEKNNEYIIELKISQRFRTPSILQNKDTGHPPFKVIKNKYNK